MPDLTPNLQLEKPTQEEFYDVDVQNRNMEKIDSNLTTVKRQVNEHLDHYITEHKTYYLDGTSGNDTNDGLSSSTAFKTWAKVKSAVDNSFLFATITINIADSTYEEDMTLSNINGKRTVQINGNGARFKTIFLERITNPVAITNITVTDMNAEQGINISQCDYVLLNTVRDVRLTYAKTGVLLVLSKAKLINCEISSKDKAVEVTVLSNCEIESTSGVNNGVVLVASASNIYKGTNLPLGTTAELKVTGGQIW